ncbi:integrator complex subunit 3 isoform X2 [Cloeon dipterum]|uniref:integrator complex subunit 3 isoform X2 n=1 Tax=Cloeon dipterum TaxID=197152 RepID=UPI00321FB09F
MPDGIPVEPRVHHQMASLAPHLNKLERSYSLVNQTTRNLSENDAHEALASSISRDPRCHDDICLGLMVATLLEPQLADKHYRDLTLISRDGMQGVVNCLIHIAAEKFTKLSESALQQLLWLTKELIKNTVTGVEHLCLIILRCIPGGDISPRNLQVADFMIDVFNQNRNWLDTIPFLIASVVYTYLRLIDDHGGIHSQNLTHLRQKEVALCVKLLRERFNDCITIGRDLVRLLQHVARIPEFERLWRDLFDNPSVFSPTFTGIQQLLQMRTSRRCLTSRVTPDMEKKIIFLTSHVRFGNHKRYQDWFHKQYLNTGESQSLRCDLIRFIVGVIHPTNEVLGSDIIPRWAVIGWLLTSCSSTVAAANAKLALFYDWLFFDPEKDSIMNIEPAILVMHHSLRSHSAVTSTLLDFLVKIIPNFYPALVDKVQAGVFASLKTILDKRVLQSLDPIFDNHKLDKDLRVAVREKFRDFCTHPGTDGSARVEDLVMIDLAPLPINNHVGDEPTFSDDEEEVPLASKVNFLKDNKKENIEDVLSNVDDTLRAHLEKLKMDDLDKQRETMEKLMNEIVNKGADQEDTHAVATYILSILKDHFKGQLIPEDLTDDLIKASIEKPLFAMFRALTNALDSSENTGTNTLISLLHKMREKEQKMGYLLLYYLKANNLDGYKPMSSVAAVYKKFYKESETSIIDNLLRDMTLCQDDDRFMFVWLVPEVYQLFPDLTQNNTQLLHLLLEVVDANQMQLLICLVLQSKLVIFDNATLLPVLQESLNWETFEQCCFWHLIEAHNIPLDDLIAILPELDFSKHHEALSSLMLFMKQERPSAELLKNIMLRTAKPSDLFVVSILQYWVLEYEDKLADIVANLLTKLVPNSPTKRKRGSQAAVSAKGPTPPSIEHVLAHLDQLRIVSKHNPKFFLLDNMQRALQLVLGSNLDPLKKKYHDLLALAEELQPRGSGTGGRGTRKAASTAKSQNSRTSRAVPVVSDSADNTSEEEEVKPKPAKKRKKANVVESD